MFEIHNKRKQFWQWDTGQRLIVHDDSCSEVHFCNGESDCSLVCEVYEEDGLRLADVPNILLQTPKAIRAFVYVCEGEDHHTQRAETFPVFKRSKPDDYVYTETEMKSYERLDERITKLEESGGGTGTVTSVAGVEPDEYGNVPLTPENIGAAEVFAVPNKAVIDGSALKMQRETTTTDDEGTETTETTDLFEVELPSGGSEGWTIDGLSAETTIADDDAVPFYDTSAAGQRKTLWGNIKSVLKTYFDTAYLKLSGGTLSGKIVLPTDDQSAGFTNSADTKIFGYGPVDSVSHLRMGDATRPLQLRGSDSAPKYNDDTLVLQSAFDTALGSYITDIDTLIGGEE